MKFFFPLFALLLSLGFASCDESNSIAGEYDNWSVRNKVALADTLRLAEAQIAKAKTMHGEQWQQHCDWRVLSSYLLSPGATPADHQKIAVRLIERGTGSGCPLYTDTVRVNYVGRLMPTSTTPQGYVFDHSGATSNSDQAFHPDFAHPVQLAVSNTVEGFSTVLQHMHIGDRWRVFLPAELGYGQLAKPGIPAGSMLIFELQLRAYWRAGASPLANR